MGLSITFIFQVCLLTLQNFCYRAVCMPIRFLVSTPIINCSDILLAVKKCEANQKHYKQPKTLISSKTKKLCLIFYLKYFYILESFE